MQFNKSNSHFQNNITKLNQDLNSIVWTMTDSYVINQYGNNILNFLDQIFDAHKPHTNIKIAKNIDKQKVKPWINNEILELIKLKDKTHHTLIKEKK